MKHIFKFVWTSLQNTGHPYLILSVTLILLILLVTVICVVVNKYYRHRFDSIKDVFKYIFDNQYRIMSDLQHIYYRIVIESGGTFASFSIEAQQLLSTKPERRTYRIKNAINKEEFVRYYFSERRFNHQKFKMMYHDILTGKWATNDNTGAASTRTDPVAFTLKNYNRLPEKLKNPKAIYMLCKLVDAKWLNEDLQVIVQKTEGLPNKTTAAFIAYEICNAIGETRYDHIFSQIGDGWERLAAAKNIAIQNKEKQSINITNRVRQILNS